VSQKTSLTFSIVTRIKIIRF